MLRFYWINHFIFNIHQVSQKCRIRFESNPHFFGFLGFVYIKHQICCRLFSVLDPLETTECCGLWSKSSLQIDFFSTLEVSLLVKEKSLFDGIVVTFSRHQDIVSNGSIKNGRSHPLLKHVRSLPQCFFTEFNLKRMSQF